MKYDGEMLARLVAQAEAAPGQMDMVMIRALIEEASELGAGRALERLGLSDRSAEGDVRELRELLSAWRDAKKAARGAVVGWAVRIVMALVLLGVAVRRPIARGARLHWKWLARLCGCGRALPLWWRRSRSWGRCSSWWTGRRRGSCRLPIWRGCFGIALPMRLWG